MSAVHPAQLFVAPQMGVAAVQVALVRQPTHLSIVVSHTDAVPAQSVLSAHCTQAPAAEQTARVGSASDEHWAEVVQVAHAPFVQKGAPGEQSVLVPQVLCASGTRKSTVASGTCVQIPALEQKARLGSANAAHWTDVVQGTHTPFVQIGVALGQPVFHTHCGVVTSTAATSIKPSMFEPPSGRALTLLPHPTPKREMKAE
jgi:hypothetical protein